MHATARLHLAATFLVIAAASACSDSTGVTPLTAAQVAAHFDSIAVVAAARADTNGSYGTRAFLASLIELPAALGATPATVSVTTANSSESWKAYEILDVTGPGSTPDSSYILLLFRDADAHTAIIADYDSAGSLQDAGLVTGDTILVNPDDASGSTSVSSIGSACTNISSSLANPLLSSFTESSCNAATFQSSLDLANPATTGLDAVLSSVSFSNVHVNGVRVVEQAEGATVRRIRTILHAAAANRHR
jgi:hypothetical protein